MADSAESKTNAKLDKFYSEAREYRDQFSENWREYEDFYEGRQWKRASKRPIENVIFQFIESELPVLTDGSPATDIIPLEDQHQQEAEVLSAAKKSEYRYNNLLLKRSQVIREALKTGTGWLYVDWDPELEHGLGHVTIRNLSWDQIYIDPLATDIDDADFVGIEFPMRLEQVIRRFPGKKSKLMDAQGMSRTRDTEASGTNDRERETQWTGFNSGDRPRVEAENIVEDTVVLQESWIKDYSLEKINEDETVEQVEKENSQFEGLENPESRKWEDHAAHILGHTSLLEELALKRRTLAAEALQVDPSDVTDADLEGLMEDPEVGDAFLALDTQIQIVEDHIKTHEIWGPQNPDGRRPKFANNYRVVLRVGEVVLYDGAPPVDDGRIPLVPYYAYKNLDSVYGTGEIANILDQQKLLNELSYLELQGLRKNANSGWVKDDNSGVKSSELTNEQGIVITKKQGTTVDRLQPGQISPQFQVKMQDQRRGVADITGMQDAMQGRKTPGVIAEGAIDTLRESNLIRVREKARINEGYSDLRLGWLVTSRIVKYWSNARKLLLFDGNGEIKRFDFDPERIEDLRFDVLIVPGSTVGMSPDMIFSQNFALLKAGVLDPMTFAESTPLPNKTQIIKKMKESQDTQATLQSLMAENEELKAMIEQLQPPQSAPAAQPPLTAV